MYDNEYEMQCIGVSPNVQGCSRLRSHHKYFEKELRTLPIEKLWEIMDELLSSHHDVPDKKKMNYEQVLELCVVLKEIDEMFRNLNQISILKNELDG